MIKLLNDIFKNREVIKLLMRLQNSDEVKNSLSDNTFNEAKNS